MEPPIRVPASAEMNSNTPYNGPVTDRMIVLATQLTFKTIKCNQPSDPLLVPLHTFIESLARSSNLNAGTFLSSLVYLHRLKKRLPATALGMHCTAHRTFLTTLIISAKYQSDGSPTTKSWARMSGVFKAAEICNMERQLLWLLDYELRVDEWELAKYLMLCCDFPVPVFAERASFGVLPVVEVKGEYFQEEYLSMPDPVYAL